MKKIIMMIALIAITLFNSCTKIEIETMVEHCSSELYTTVANVKYEIADREYLNEKTDEYYMASESGEIHNTVLYYDVACNEYTVKFYYKRDFYELRSKDLLFIKEQMSDYISMFKNGEIMWECIRVLEVKYAPNF